MTDFGILNSEDWIGFVKHGFVKVGFVKHGFVKGGICKKSRFSVACRTGVIFFAFFRRASHAPLPCTKCAEQGAGCTKCV